MPLFSRLRNLLKYSVYLHRRTVSELILLWQTSDCITSYCTVMYCIYFVNKYDDDDDDICDHLFLKLANKLTRGAFQSARIQSVL